MDRENRSPPDEASSSLRQTSPQENFNRLQHRLSTLERQVEEKQCRPIPNKHEMLSLLKMKREICLTRERLCIILETNDPSRREKHKRKRQQETSTKEIFERNITELESIIEREGSQVRQEREGNQIEQAISQEALNIQQHQLGYLEQSLHSLQLQFQRLREQPEPTTREPIKHLCFGIRAWGLLEAIHHTESKLHAIKEEIGPLGGDVNENQQKKIQRQRLSEKQGGYKKELLQQLKFRIERAGGVDSRRLGITALPGEPESRRVNPSIEELEALLVDNVPLTVQATSMREQVEAVDERREGQTSTSTEGAVGGVTSAMMMLTTSVTGLDDKSETVKIDSRDDCNESKQHLKLPSSPVDNTLQTPTEEEKEDLYQDCSDTPPQQSGQALSPPISEVKKP